MNNQHKRKNRTKLILYVLLLSILTAIAVSGTFAKYTSSEAGTGEAEVAAWRFNVEGLDTTTLTRTDLAQTVTDGLLAPGTEGYFAIGIDAYGAEVAVDYEIEIFNITNKPRNLKFYTNSTYTTEIAGVENEIENEDGTMEKQTTYTVKGHMTVAEVSNESTAKRTVRIYWQWPFESEGEDSDIIDTEDAFIGSMELDIRVVGTQSMGAGEINGPTYEINYDLGGGTGDIASQNKQEGVDTSVTTLVPTKSGYTFLGWSTVANATQATYAAGTVFTVDENTTLYAVWEANPYKVTYNYATNGGTSATKTSDEVKIGSSIDLSPTATKSGYNFVGWNTNSSATKGLTSLEMGDSNVTLYAIYSKEITVTFRYYNNKTTNKKVTIYNTATTGTLTAPGALGTPSGYTFNGWSTSNAANPTSKIVSTGSISTSSNRTYYASYTYPVTVTFNANGGTGTTVTREGTAYMGYTGTKEGASITIPSNTYTKSGYKFNGWNSSSAGSGTSYTVSSAYTFTGNTTIYATWTVASAGTITLTKSISKISGTIPAGVTVSVNVGGNSGSQTSNGTGMTVFFNNQSKGGYGGGQSGTVTFNTGTTSGTFTIEGEGYYNNLKITRTSDGAPYTVVVQ